MIDFADYLKGRKVCASRYYVSHILAQSDWDPAVRNSHRYLHRVHRSYYTWWRMRLNVNVNINKQILSIPYHVPDTYTPYLNEIVLLSFHSLKETTCNLLESLENWINFCVPFFVAIISLFILRQISQDYELISKVYFGVTFSVKECFYAFGYYGDYFEKQCQIWN